MNELVFPGNIIEELKKFEIKSLEEIPGVVEMSRKNGWDFPDAERYLMNYYHTMKLRICQECEVPDDSDT